MLIYKATNRVTKKCYIGQTTKTLLSRKNTHLYNSKLMDLYFYRSIRKNGWDVFTWEIICECDTKEELDEMEFHYIKQYNSFGSGGYNLTEGGEGTIGRVCSKNTRSRIGESNKGKKAWNKGLTKESDDRIKRQSESQIGFRYSDKSKKKMSESAKIRSDTDEHKKLFQENMWSDETKKKRRNTIIKNGMSQGKKNPKYRHDISDNVIIDMVNDGVNGMNISKTLKCGSSTIYKRIQKLKTEGKL